MNLNKVILAGNLCRDPQVKFLGGVSSLAEFGLATTHRFKGVSGENKENTIFVDCVAFGKTAEFITQYFQKGKPIYIEGRLKLDQWEDKVSGQKRSKLSVVVESVQFVGSNRDGEKRDGDKAAPTPAKSVGQVQGELVDDSSIPF